MLTKSGSKLLDFGLAKLRRAGGADLDVGDDASRHARARTAHGMILGTLQYMAPEQVEGKDADARTDIWALGAVIYEMVTGTRPFKGDTPASIIGAILKDEPPPMCVAPAGSRRRRSIAWCGRVSPKMPTIAGNRRTT